MHDYIIYFSIINILGFILGCLNIKFKLSSILTILSCMGASPGILLSIILFDRKLDKGVMMERVFFLCTFVIQLILAFFYLRGKSSVRFDIWSIFTKYKVFTIYIGIINLVTFISFGIDKYKAVHGSRRIKITTLLGLSILGGSIGGYLGMYAFRHKTNKDYFKYGIPLILCMQLFILLFVVNIL